MNRKLITLGFVRMMLPPASLRPITDPKTAATLERRIEDAKRWREYDFPSYRRFVRTRTGKPIATVNVVQLPGTIRRKAG